MSDAKSAIELDSNMRISSIGNTPYKWVDPLNCDSIKILGFNWIERERVYRRMPLCEDGVLPFAVDDLAYACSGGQLKFVTNSSRIAIDAEFDYPPNMDHMPPTGQMGFDCYTGTCGQMRYAMTTRFDNTSNAYVSPLFTDIEPKERLYTINFPLYNRRLKKLLIGFDPESTLTLPTHLPQKKIVVYGTSITQGGCASRPGMSYTNILSREIDAEFINLGFSGNGKGEPPVVEIIAGIDDMDLLVIDYEANIVDDIYDNLPKLTDIVRKAQPELPLLVLSRIKYGQENIRPENNTAAMKRRDFQRDFVAERKRAGDANIEFFDGSVLLGDKDPGEYAVDGCHLTDAGFLRMAEGLLETFSSYVT